MKLRWEFASPSDRSSLYLGGVIALHRNGLKPRLWDVILLGQFCGKLKLREAKRYAIECIARNASLDAKRLVDQAEEQEAMDAKRGPYFVSIGAGLCRCLRHRAQVLLAIKEMHHGS